MMNILAYSKIIKMRSQQRRTSVNQQKLLKQTFQSIAAKFILNLPVEQKNQKIRLSYHYLKAYYYYIDEAMKQLFPNEDPKKVEGKWFYDQLNLVVGQYMKKVDSQDVIKAMSRHRPSCGAIILNQRENKVLVIQWNGRLGFPKGGRNQGQTSEDCAARQVKQQVGLFIHNKIRSNEKVQFTGRNDVPVTFFIIRKFDQNQPLKIDKNELDSAFWMNISDLSRQINKFTQRCRQAWRLFQSNLQMQPKLSMDQFLNIYRDRSRKKQKNKDIDVNQNPFLNFKLDKQKLFAVFKTVESQNS